MKKTISIFILLLVMIPIFATWETGVVVDEFGDPTGDYFLYYKSNGTFSNSATSSSTCVYRIYPVIEVKPDVAIVRWEFDIHNYDWSNPIINGSGVPRYRIKDDAGNTYTFGKKYTSATPWNALYNEQSESFTELLSSNQKLKVVIYIDNTTYNLTIDCSDFNSAYEKFKSNFEDKIGYWNTVIKTKDDYYFSIQLDEIMGKKSYYASAMYEKYEKFSCRNKTYICYYKIQRNNDYSGEIDFTVKLYDLYETSSKKTSSGKIKKITFKTNTLEASINNDNMSTSYYGVAVEEYFNNSKTTSMDSVIHLLQSQDKTTIEFEMLDGNIISYMIDGTEFLEYLNKAKNTPWL